MGEVNPPSPLANTLKGTCPRCGQGRLYKGPVQFAATCRDCGLDFDSFNVGDGPAAFLILIVGAILTVCAVVFDLKVSPPWYVHLVWIPVGLALTVGGLRLAKSWLIAQEYRHRAREGKIVS
ncbi:DUF983 domain-containing protein [Sphingomonas daechungensis]|uniref:DUF983 domain-containing protein n=1 Tax=Sphingomonas daechungensis TaxID=1176646 RepID=A0ABX6T3J4_9SPHN|nr:DUF983 domain-containing protein [Sphingomonas daechungensis]QNP44009.1 DUF983 domain-containing protein [Sphingomonas daechungensis]